MSRADPQDEGQVPKCIWCGEQMQSVGVREFRTGGTSGGWKLVFGEWAELKSMFPSMPSWVSGRE